mmetsp:Transcript_15456/g.36945  ORF Transcript_15456/g.36945 Transcript_15456/m.36945 type:complete len:111 (+) Transcript_15456:348-680(+)
MDMDPLGLSRLIRRTRREEANAMFQVRGVSGHTGRQHIANSYVDRYCDCSSIIYNIGFAVPKWCELEVDYNRAGGLWHSLSRMGDDALHTNEISRRWKALESSEWVYGVQ